MTIDVKIELMIVLQLLIALILGAVIGLERERHGNSAGIRTYAAVALGAALFTIIGIHATDTSAASRIVANIVTGIGFLGAGIIYKDSNKGLTHGLTTASSIWATAAVGVAVAYSMFFFVTASAIAVFFPLSLHHFKWYNKLKEKWKINMEHDHHKDND